MAEFSNRILKLEAARKLIDLDFGFLDLDFGFISCELLRNNGTVFDRDFEWFRFELILNYILDLLTLFFTSF